MKIYYLIVCLIINCIRQTIALDSELVLNASSPGVVVKSSSNERKVDQIHSVLLKGNAVQNQSNLDVTEFLDNECPSLDATNRLTQIQLINRLTAPCRYDRSERPYNIENGLVSRAPIDVYVRVYIYVFQSPELSDLQFTVRGLMQMRYNDPRLQFGKYALSRTEPLMGESSLRNHIWVPHIFLANEQNSNILGTNEKDILTVISPDGTVIISSRIQATLYCWMRLQKFPFDEQFCPTVVESWIYNSSELRLHWETNKPVAFDPKLHVTEYAIQNVWTNESIITADLNDLRHGAFIGNYSSITFTVHLTREVGYYIMDYFLPSIMIVAISWVSFWLQADQTPARTTLGCTTLLSFITLASSQGNNLPKVNDIKISEVWFLGCTCFIFGSLMEFAFVNTIWRRKHSVEVKKMKSKYILKSTLTPKMKRQSSTDHINCDNNFSNKNEYERYLRIGESPVIITVDEETTNKFKSTESIISQTESERKAQKHTENSSWATMTPHEVSLWIDRRARFVFPLTFLIFNAFFWTFVYCF